jgi:dTDP-4-dehydrorhamnose reductase
VKFLVLGSGGMAGHILSVYLQEVGHEVRGFARRNSLLVDTVIGDATDFPLLSQTIKKERYDCVVNCVGILNQFAEEDKSTAVLINSYLPHFLCGLVIEEGIHLVHLSTDCVFSGDRGGYTEEDFRDGRTFYDRSKALGELDAPNCFTLRSSIIGPDINPKGIGLMNWFMQQENSVGGYLNAIWTGQTTLQLAKTVEAAAEMRAVGLYNMVPEQSITKYDLLCLMNKYLRAEPIEIRPIDNPSVNKSLVRTRFDFDYKIPDYETMIIELAQWMQTHKHLYPQYRL